MKKTLLIAVLGLVLLPLQVFATPRFVLQSAVPALGIDFPATHHAKALSDIHPRMGETIEGIYVFRNGDNVANDVEVRVWHTPACQALNPNPIFDPFFWDFRDATLITSVHINQVQPQELVEGRVSIPVTEENGFMLGGMDFMEDNSCNNIIFEFFSPNNQLGFWSTTNNLYVEVMPANYDAPDYIIEEVYVNEVPIDAVNFELSNEKEFAVRYKIKNVKSTSEVNRDGMNICLIPWHEVDYGFMRPEACQIVLPEQLPKSGESIDGGFYIHPKQNFFFSEDEVNNKLHLGQENQMLLQINSHEKEENYKNNNVIFNINFE